MNSAPEPRRPVPSDFLRARADKLLSDLTQHSSDAQTGMPVAHPAAVNDDRPPSGRWTGRGVRGLLLAAACIGVAAIAWQSFRGDKAKPPQPVLTTALENPQVSAQPSPPTVQADVAKAAPPQPELVAQAAPKDAAPTTGALPPDLAQLLQRKDAAIAAPLQSAPAAQAAPEGVAPTTAALPPDLAQVLQRRDAAMAAPLQPAPAAQAAPEGGAPTAAALPPDLAQVLQRRDAAAQAAPEGGAPTTAALPPDLAQVLQTMSRDLASVGQGIEQLKANQERMARDNAKIAEQLKLNQEQLGRLTAKASEQNPRPKPSAPLPPNSPTAHLR